MKIVLDYSLLYEELFTWATTITSCVLRDYPGVDYREVAHDITTDFLYSGSFHSTFNPDEGSLRSFFGSYVRKKLFGVKEKMWKQAHTFISLMPEQIPVLGGDGFTPVYECKDILRKGREIAKSAPKREFTLKLFDALMRSVVKFDKINFKYVSEECFISESYARVCAKFLLTGIKRRLFYG